jgi:hypothetical protein
MAVHGYCIVRKNNRGSDGGNTHPESSLESLAKSLFPLDEIFRKGVASFLSFIIYELILNK